MSCWWFSDGNRYRDAPVQQHSTPPLTPSMDLCCLRLMLILHTPHHKRPADPRPGQWQLFPHSSSISALAIRCPLSCFSSKLTGVTPGTVSCRWIPDASRFYICNRLVFLLVAHGCLALVSELLTNHFHQQSLLLRGWNAHIMCRFRVLSITRLISCNV